MEKKLKYLEMLQVIINRMAGNSFLLKGWCVTLVSAILALAAKDSNTDFILVAFYPVLMFWILDAYFLWQERLFRKLYDEVRIKNEANVDFSMDTSHLKPHVESWPRVGVSATLLIFYLTMVGAILLAILIVSGWLPKRV
jgi:hypothetical protein